MIALDRKDIYGSDLAWYAIDDIGCIAQFTTGFGPIPGVVLESATTLDGFFEYINLLPESGDAKLSDHAMRIERDRNCDFSSFLRDSRRGIFTYCEIDYGPRHACFSIPVRLLNVNSLKAEMHLYIQAIA